MADSGIDGELILLIAPLSEDPYYAEVADKIFEFQVSFAEILAAHGDAFLILTDDSSYSKYRDALSETAHESGYVLQFPISDIWAREFSLSNTVAPVMFHNTAAAGQGGGRRGQADADHVQEEFAKLLEEVGIIFAESDLLNDGGNFVDDYDGRAVISRKFLRYNDLSEDEARAIIQEQTGIEHLRFIEADEQGGLKHSDGVVCFVNPNVLVINSYPEDDEYENALSFFLFLLRKDRSHLW